VSGPGAEEEEHLEGAKKMCPGVSTGVSSKGLTISRRGKVAQGEEVFQERRV